MDHRDHVRLIAPAVRAGETWADVGSGIGAFTLALAELVTAAGRIVSVDADATALGQQAEALAARFPDVHVEQRIADFRRPLDLAPLDGIVMANSLHFVPRREQAAVLRALAAKLRPGGRFVIVEYDAEHGNRWVPHPFGAAAWPALAAGAGLVNAREIGRVPSRFLGAIYSAVAERPPAS